MKSTPSNQIPYWVLRQLRYQPSKKAQLAFTEASGGQSWVRFAIRCNDLINEAEAYLQSVGLELLYAVEKLPRVRLDQSLQVSWPWTKAQRETFGRPLRKYYNSEKAFRQHRMTVLWARVAALQFELLEAVAPDKNRLFQSETDRMLSEIDSITAHSAKQAAAARAKRGKSKHRLKLLLKEILRIKGVGVSSRVVFEQLAVLAGSRVAPRGPEAAEIQTAAKKLRVSITSVGEESIIYSDGKNERKTLRRSTVKERYLVELRKEMRRSG